MDDPINKLLKVNNCTSKFITMPFYKVRPLKKKSSYTAAYRSLPYKKRRYGRTNSGYSKKRINNPTKSFAKTTLQADITFAKLTYFFYVQYQNSAEITGRTWRGNSIWDPDQSGTGTTATGYSYYSVAYNTYCVNGSRFSATFINRSAQERIVMVLPVTASGGMDQTTPYQRALSQPYIKWAVLGPNGSSRSVVTLTSYMSTSKIFGVKDPSQKHLLEANMGADPSKQWYWQTFMYDEDGTSGPIDISIAASIKYYTKFNERNNIDS